MIMDHVLEDPIMELDVPFPSVNITGIPLENVGVRTSCGSIVTALKGSTALM